MSTLDPGSLERSIAQRLAARKFPSVFQAWNPADNLQGEDRLVTLARHDLAWIGPEAMGMKWNDAFAGLATGFAPETIAAGMARRRMLLEMNPCMVLLTEIRYRDAGERFLPKDHAWWKRDAQGKLVMGWEEGHFIQLDFANPPYREHVAGQAAAAVKSGVFDGVMLDWWHDDDERLALVQAVREAIGPDALIIANTNDRTCPRTATHINGYFMECTVTDRPAKWQQIAETLTWAQTHLRAPRVNCLETWYHTGREDLHLMRATTTLALTHSDGYCLFSDPNPLPTPDHLHNWYPFWDKSLGRPLPPDAPCPDGPEFFAAWNLSTPLPPGQCQAVARHFENGTAVYNPMGHEAIVVRFRRHRTSAATGRRSAEHYLANCDGDLYLA